MLARFLVGVALLVASGAPLGAQSLDPKNPPRGATSKEIEQGEKAAREYESLKTTKILKRDASPQATALYEKLEGMARKIGAKSDRPDIQYQVKIVDDKEINAFTLPGGRLYFFRGLIDFCASDDELAGVMAHEIGHNTRLHALRGQKKAKNLNWLGLAAMAALLAGGDGANVAQFSQYALIGVMNGYTLEFEKEADHEAVETLIAAGYNPSALVSFMERLKRQEGEFAARLGFLQTHPLSAERAEAAKSQLEARGIPFNPRDVQGALVAKSEEKTDRFRVSVGKTLLFELAKSEPRRVEIAVERTNALLRANLQLWEMNATPGGELRARGQILLVASEADAKLLGKTRAQLAQSWRGNFQNLFWREQVSGKF